MPTILALALSSCATTTGRQRSPTESVPASPLTTPAPLQLGLKWSLSSAEHGAIYRQTYRLATDRILARAREQAPGTWAVIMDADETVLDNGEFRRRLAAESRPWSDEAWNDWVRERRATALPGAVEFTSAVHGAGGRVVIVTNRAQSVCSDARDNLRTVGIAADAVLCRTEPGNDKNPRFDSVRSGTAVPGLPTLAVLGYFGDNIRDFPNRSQAQPEPWFDFGDTLFVLPNPMYGSWESSPFDINQPRSIANGTQQ